MYRLKQEILHIQIPVTKNLQKFILKNNMNGKIIDEFRIESTKNKLKLDLTTLEPHYNYEYMFIEYNTKEEEIDTKTSNIIPVFQDINNGLEYSYYENENTSKLLVVFSSSVFSNRFNYIKTLKDINQSKLFIADENNLRKETTASYYLGNMGIFDYEKKIFNLIEKIRIHNNLSRKDVVLIGSSKGGFAALYYTFKYNYGFSIVGSPTIYLGKMHKYSNKGQQIITHLTGDLSEKSISILNNIISNSIKITDYKPSIYYHVGSGEPRYSKHAVPFIEFLSTKDITLKTLDLGDYSNHSLVANYYPSFLTNTIYKILN